MYVFYKKIYIYIFLIYHFLRIRIQHTIKKKRYRENLGKSQELAQYEKIVHQIRNRDSKAGEEKNRYDSALEKKGRAFTTRKEGSRTVLEKVRDIADIWE